MTVADILQRLGLELAAGAGGLQRPVGGAYIGDLLSHVMAHAPAGSLWLTVQNHANALAVALLQDLAGICLVGGRRLPPGGVAKADEKNIPVLLSPQDAYTLAGRLHRLGVGR